MQASGSENLPELAIKWFIIKIWGFFLVTVPQNLPMKTMVSVCLSIKGQPREVTSPVDTWLFKSCFALKQTASAQTLWANN